MESQSMALGDAEILGQADAMNFEPDDQIQMLLSPPTFVQNQGNKNPSYQRSQPGLQNQFPLPYVVGHSHGQPVPHNDIYDQYSLHNVSPSRAHQLNLANQQYIQQQQFKRGRTQADPSSNMNILYGSGAHHHPNYSQYNQLPVYCSLHGRILEFFCFDDKQRICAECVRNQHKTHKFNFINVCANINKELLDCLKTRSAQLQEDRKTVHKKALNDFKLAIRKDILDIKEQAVKAIGDACTRILSQINKGEVRNIEREMELFQTFFYNKIQNFNHRIKQSMEQVKLAIKDEKFHEIMLDKEKYESFDQELSLLQEQIKQKKIYFNSNLQKIKESLDLSSFQQVKEKAEMAQRSLELFSRENRISVFVPNKKQLIMHDLKYFTSKTIDIQSMEHTFGNFSTILQSKLNGRIYICGGKQRKKLFEYDERNECLIEKQEMHFGRSNHAFVEVTLTGELVAIGGWDGEKSMSQTEGFTITNNSWRHLPRLVEERHSLSACRLGNYIYAIGGSSAINYGSSLSTIERLNFAQPNFEGSTRWELIFLFGQCCDAKRSQLGSVALSDNQIMLFGGFLDTDLTNMCFQIDTNTFEITKMDCQMRKNKKFIKFKDYTLRQGRFVYVIDDENEIHQFDMNRNNWYIVETNREN